MKCKVCGTYNDDFMEYCQNCAAPLTEEEAPAPEAAHTQTSTPVSASAPQGEQTAWGFVRAPQWIQPDFDANTVSEEDIPEDYLTRKSAPQQTSVQQAYEDVPVQTYNAVQRPFVQAHSDNAPTVNTQQQAYAVAPSYGTQQTYAPTPSYGTQPQSYAAASAYGAPQQSYGATSSYGAQQGYNAAPSYGTQNKSNVKFADPAEDDFFGYDPAIGSSGGGKNPRSGGAGGYKGGPKGKSKGLMDDKMKNILFWAAAGVLVLIIGVCVFFFLRGRNKDANTNVPQSAAAATTQPADTQSASGTDENGVKTSSNKTAFLGGLFSKSPITKPATIEEGTTESGDPAYIITIYAKKNSTVRFRAGDLVKESAVDKGSLKVRIPKDVWIPKEPVDAPSIEVYPDITVISKDGTETPVEFDSPIVIPLSTIDLTLTEPATETVSTVDGNITVSGMVGDTTAEVYVNDTQLFLDESGNFSGVYTLTAYGSQEVVVEARKNGYQITRKTLTADYPDPASGAAPAATDPTAPAASTAPAAATPAGGTPSNATAVAYVTTDGLNVRDQGAPSGNVLGKLALGTKVYIITENVGNDWSKIVYNNAEAYASFQYLHVVATAAEYATTSATVNTDNLKMRNASSTSSDILTELPTGTTVSYIKDAGSDWCMIEYNGMIGYVSAKYINK